MSFTSYPEAQARLHRSELAVPGSNAALFEKAAGSDADVVFLDLEDAMSPGEKEHARTKVIAAVALDGKLLDIASIRMAGNLLRQAERLARRAGS